MRRFSPVTLALLLAIGGKAFGQEYRYPVVQGLIEGGGAITTGGTSQVLDSGFTVGTGILIHPAHGPLGFRVTLDYTRLDASREQIDAQRAEGFDVSHGEANIFNVRLNGVYERPISPYARAYITAGVGLAYEFFEPGAAFAPAPVKVENPIAGLGVAVAEALDEGIREVIPAFSINAAVGLDFSHGGRNSFFIEAGYEHNYGSLLGTGFFPLRAGFRF